MDFDSKEYERVDNFRVQKKASYLHRTATTVYPCCVPTLGDSAGAGRVGLAGANIQTFYIFARQLFDLKFVVYCVIKL